MFTSSLPVTASQNIQKHALWILAASILFGLCAGAASAQSMTPQQFVDACSSNVGNRVNIAQQTKFQTASTRITYATPTGCTVVLAAGASLELDTVTLNFGGPLVVHGSIGGKVVLDKATITAPSVNFNLTGFEGQLQINESRLAATVGNLALAFGEKGKMEINQSGIHYDPRVSARGTLSITAGASFSGTILRSGLQGAQGVDITLNGFDSSMKFETVDILLSTGATSPAPYTVGSLNIIGNAPKVSIEMNDVDLMETSQNIDIELAGEESKLLLKNVMSATGGRDVFLGATGKKGEVNLENSRFFGQPAVIVTSGESGSTKVVNATSGITGGLIASERVVISTGVGGSCVGASIYHSAPILDICR
jgi:hypothetical protein